jgi:hypothetical protein
MFAALSICLLIAVYAFFLEIKWLDRDKLSINLVTRYVQKRHTGRCRGNDETQKTTCETEDETSACEEPTGAKSMDVDRNCD